VATGFAGCRDPSGKMPSGWSTLAMLAVPPAVLPMRT
jgi:hypothetical protein